ncbi:AmmeMemoRadiSam system protein B [Zavarzinella formosa]|uniref:AmmeMemoRadiSam system protein B n=1 Tax=Zavarzinella formosa TaxID=360055 RepID=UPI0002D39D43|nr:AmmeMemoRadiSam system protein B [Zavarzinella formosa]
MTELDIPKLRPGLKAVAGDKPDTVVIVDQYRLGDAIEISHAMFELITLFDGRKNLKQIREETAKMFEGEPVPMETLVNLVRGLDLDYLLDTPRLREKLNTPDRPPTCVGVYDADPEKARKQLKKLFTNTGGPGLPGEPGCRVATDGAVRAVLVPHMDYLRGGVTYGWGFKELVERTDASLFVIIGTSHYSGYRFSLSRQNFATSFGKVPTDQAYVDRIAKHYGPGLFDDPYAHVPEHSIELEVAMLQYVFDGKRPFRIVPLLTGSYFDCVGKRTNPRDQADIARMISALKLAEAEAGEKVCYVISGDLAHIGPKFEDPDLLSDEQLKESKKQDDRLMQFVAAADTDGYFGVIAAEEDSRRICGLPPTYLTLEAAKPKRGKLLHYGRYIQPEGIESVSFAAVAFD